MSMAEETAVEAETETPTETPAETPTETPTETPSEAAPESEPTSGEINWRDTITDPDLRKVAERFNSPTDAVKSIADLRKRESIPRVPGKDATEEEVSAYRKAIGVPDTPDEYKFEMPEGVEATDRDKAIQSMFAKAFHENGITGQAATNLQKALNEFAVQEMESTINADKNYVKQTEDALRQEWGDDYERNVSLGTRAAKEMFGADFEAAKHIEMKDGRFLLDHPVLIKAIAGIGAEMNEGRIGPSMSESQRDTLQGRIDDLQSQKFAARDKGDNRLAQKLDAEQAALYEKLQGQAA
jgi:hypothetical protein